MLYITSDIHGCYDQFQELLDKVSPASDDTIVVMGDVIDRGPKSAEMLWWCIEEASSNVRFLLGNHEDMAGCVIERDVENLRMSLDDPWVYNGGADTAHGLMNQTTPEWRANRLVPWLRGLKPYLPMKVGERQIMIVHAGFDPRAWHVDVEFHCDEMTDPLSHRDTVDVGFGFGEQREQVMVWMREGWYDTKDDAPLETFFGHTPTTFLTLRANDNREWYDVFATDAERERTRDAWWRSVPSELGRIWHYRNRHNVDCGCAYGGRLAMLRVDDMEEFYVKGA